jgi:hypothetical protein
MKDSVLFLSPQEVQSLRLAAGIGAEVEGVSEAVASANLSTSVLEEKAGIVYQAFATSVSS